MPKPSARAGDGVTGYEKGDRVVDFKGKATGWKIVGLFKKYRLNSAMSDSGQEIVLQKGKYYAAAYTLGEGMLVRGTVTGRDYYEAVSEAKLEAERYIERDAEDEGNADELDDFDPEQGDLNDPDYEL